MVSSLLKDPVEDGSCVLEYSWFLDCSVVQVQAARPAARTGGQSSWVWNLVAGQPTNGLDRLRPAKNQLLRCKMQLPAYLGRTDFNLQHVTL